MREMRRMREKKRKRAVQRALTERLPLEVL